MKILSSILLISFAICISARYLNFSTVVTQKVGAREDGDELIHYAYRISPFFSENSTFSYNTEILYEMPDNVSKITYVWIEEKGVSIQMIRTNFRLFQVRTILYHFDSITIDYCFYVHSTVQIYKFIDSSQYAKLRVQIQGRCCKSWRNHYENLWTKD